MTPASTGVRTRGEQYKIKEEEEVCKRRDGQQERQIKETKQGTKQKEHDKGQEQIVKNINTREQDEGQNENDYNEEEQVILKNTNTKQKKRHKKHKQTATLTPCRSIITLVISSGIPRVPAP